MASAHKLQHIMCYKIFHSFFACAFVMSGCLVFSSEELKFRLQFGMVVSGPSSSGKTTWLLRFLKHVNSLVTPAPASILYAYGQYHDNVPRLEAAGVSTYPGLPDDGCLKKFKKPTLLVLDDFMGKADERYLTDLYTKKSHHQNIGVILLTQNIFDKSLKVARNNSQYIVLMKAPSAALGIRTLGSQLFLGQIKYFIDAYGQATERPYGYLLLDMHASSDPAFRLRSNVFPSEHQVVFLP